MMVKMGSHVNAGKMLATWAREAGFGSDGGKLVTSISPQYQASFLVRMSGPSAEEAIKFGMAIKEEKEEWRKGWEDWEATEGQSGYLRQKISFAGRANEG